MQLSQPHFNAPIRVDGLEAVIVAIDSSRIAFRFIDDAQGIKWNVPRSEQNESWVMKIDHNAALKSHANSIINSPYMNN